MDAIAKENTVDAIWEIVKEIQHCKRDVLGNFLRLGTLLIAAQEEERYMSFASHIRSFGDFLEEMDIRHSTAYNAMAVRREFGEEILAGSIQVEPTRLVRLLPLKIKKEERTAWLKKAQELPAKAFQDELRERAGKMASDACLHSETETWERCRICNKFIRKAN